jgi:ubiquinone/menaquinone biosynthesis C-methylase UbiE/DNA-binding HxlR family transcriptional regulator
MNLNPDLRLLKVLGDETRLSLLYVLRQTELSVSELIGILDLHQSSISRHLTQIRNAQLIQDRKEGTLVYYRWSEELRSSKMLQDFLAKVWDSLEDAAHLDARLAEVLEARRRKSEDFFDRIAGRYTQVAESGGGAEALLAGFGSLLQCDTSVDIGCGEGDLSLLLARGCKRVIAVDRSPRMLEVVRQRSQEAAASEIETRQGDLEELPLEDGCADLAVMSQVLHHAAEPESALCEMARILKHQGRYLLLDLVAHDQEWTRDKLGDHWLGFRESALRDWLLRAGLEVETIENIGVRNGLPVLLCIGRKA